MSELETMGIMVQRSYLATSTDVGGVQVAGDETTELAFTLPKQTAVQATFTREGLTKKLVKIFKKEIQTGDAPFDAAVYVSTDTPEETAHLLTSNVVRAIVGRIVAAGGSVELDGAFVKLLVPGHLETDDDDTITLVKALIG
ncbi:MAG: hypothetical protein NT062_10225 [Proteobacteria bacterium]|nr:hypothetical protein [Pseudomonadota bacterium]